MLRNIDIALLRTFVAVADHASMTIAGNALNVTQGAVSQQIRRLEDLLGDPLLERDRRGQRLTPAGERLLGKARQMLNLNDEIWREMTARGAEGRVRLGLPHDLVGAFMAPALKAFTDAYPKVELSLTCEASPNLLAALANGEIDIAVVEEPAGPSKGECLGMERLVWVGASGGRARFKRPLPVSMIADTCAFRPAVLAALTEAGMAWRTVFESGSVEATAAMVRTDLVVTTWLAATVPADLEILDQECGLPTLPSFAINLHLSKTNTDIPTNALAHLVRERFLRGRQAA
jgi:DNA-binding transcriptional LysR family regulator